MELRSCCHLHFIRAMKGGLVIRTLNVNRGRPVLKLKALEDIYETLDAKDQNVILQPKDNTVKVEGPSTCTIVKRNLISDLDASEFSCSDDDEQRNSDVDDISFSEMTLKQIKENCKAKKRKWSKHVDFRIEEMCTLIKQETDEDECDLMEPLITWKSKVSKKVKAKSKRPQNLVSSPSEIATSIIKEEQILSDPDSIQSEGSFPAPINIKVEVPEPDSSESQNSILFAGDSSLPCDNQVDSCVVVKREVAEIRTESDPAIALCSDSSNATCFLVDSCGVVQREVIEITTECDPGIALSSDSQNATCFLVDSCGVVYQKVIEIKDEFNPWIQPLCSDSQNAICSIGDSSFIYDNQVDYSAVEPRQVTEMDTECDQGTGDSSFIYDNQVDYSAVEPRQVTEMDTKCDQGTQELISLTREPQYCLVSEVYHEFTEHVIPQPHQFVDSLVNFCGLVPKEMTEPATECFLGTQKLISLTEEPEYCVVNEAGFEVMEHDNSEPVQILSASCDEIKKVDIPKINNQQCSDLPLSESKGEGYSDQPDCADIFRGPMLSTSDCSSDVHDEFPSPSTNHAIPCNSDTNTNVQIPAVVIHGCLQYSESIHGSEDNVPDDSTRDDSPSNLETSALCSSSDEYNSGPGSCFALSVDELPTTEDKQSQSSSVADAERVCFPEIVHHDASEELAISDGGESYHHDSKLNRPPQRLLSTRMAISPDSQEKLCQAVESIELHDEEHYRPRKKLCFGQQTGMKTKTTTAARSDHIARVRSSANHKQSLVRPKNEKRLAQPEGDHKSPQHSLAAPRFSTGCTSIEVCSQSAIAFSQRQMQDFECLATKLTNELKTMKEIAESRIFSEGCTSLKYKTSEVRMAIKNANRVEQLANKWLSIMARDCNRFCKIMRLTENDSGTPERETVVNKERKKITFADEAGEELCQVRLFKNEFTSLEPDTEKSEQLY